MAAMSCMIGRSGSCFNSSPPGEPAKEVIFPVGCCSPSKVILVSRAEKRACSKGVGFRYEVGIVLRFAAWVHRWNFVVIFARHDAAEVSLVGESPTQGESFTSVQSSRRS